MPDIQIDITEKPRLLFELPLDPSGYGHTSCLYKDLELTILFEYFCEQSKSEKVGHISFGHCVSFYVIDQNSSSDLIPPTEDAVFEIDGINSSGRAFNGYILWLSNSRKTYVVYAKSCKFDRSNASVEGVSRS